jgi:hypothetical protein
VILAMGAGRRAAAGILAHLGVDEEEDEGAVGIGATTSRR